jgi:DNA mismatch endonuclease (patch repair protein)
MDHLTEKHRSWNMSRIKSKNTKPELHVRSLLHRMGYRFRIHKKGLPGKPDIILPKYRSIIFVHSCFFHRHSDCKRATIPKSNTDYWISKFIKNVERDRKVQNELLELGWKVLVVWECETKDDKLLSYKLRSFLNSK